MANSNTVLIIDDEIDITINLKSIISQTLDSSSIKLAHSFSEAKNILETYNPELLFIDVNLGDGSGFDVLDILNTKSEKKSKVIMMSAYVTEEEIGNAKKNGVDAFMQKPFTKELVKKRLSEIF